MTPDINSFKVKRFESVNTTPQRKKKAGASSLLEKRMKSQSNSPSVFQKNSQLGGLRIQTSVQPNTQEPVPIERSGSKRDELNSEIMACLDLDYAGENLNQDGDEFADIIILPEDEEDMIKSELKSPLKLRAKKGIQLKKLN